MPADSARPTLDLSRRQFVVAGMTATGALVFGLPLRATAAGPDAVALQSVVEGDRVEDLDRPHGREADDQQADRRQHHATQARRGRSLGVHASTVEVHVGDGPSDLVPACPDWVMSRSGWPCPATTET